MSYRREPRDIHEVAQVMKEIKAETRSGFFDTCAANPLGTPKADRDPQRPVKLRRVGPGLWEER
jgi:hypothetical protein